MKGLVFFLFCFNTLISFSQKVFKPIEYYIIKNNEITKFLSYNLNLLELPISQSRMSIAGGFEAKCYINGFYTNVKSQFHYLDRMAEALNSNATTAYSVYKDQKSRDAEANIGYFFRKTVKAKVPVFLYNRGRTRYYINVDANKVNFYGFSIGYKSGFVNIMIPSGQKFTGYENNNAPAGTFSNISTTMQYGWLVLGISKGYTTDLIIKINEGSEKENHHFFRLYSNVLIATHSNLEDVYGLIEPSGTAGSNKTLVYRYVLNGSIPMSRFGINFGIEDRSFKKFGSSQGIEVGYMPGVKDDILGNLYVSLRFGYSINKIFK